MLNFKSKQNLFTTKYFNPKKCNEIEKGRNFKIKAHRIQTALH